MENYENFVNDLQKNIYETLGIPISDMRFIKKGEPGASEGDRLMVTVEKHKCSAEVCGIHIQEVFDTYQSGMPMEKLVNQLSEHFSEIRSMNIYEAQQNMTDYEKIKSKLFIRLLNTDKCEVKLNNAIHKQIGDIALALYLKISDIGSNTVSTIIKRDIFNHWGKDEDEVFNEALLNTYFISPPRTFLWEKLLVNPNYNGENFMDIANPCELNKNSMGNCLSTTTRTNGAVAIFLPGVADRIAYLLGSDFYAVFTSIHEVMIHSTLTSCVEELSTVLKDTIEDSTPKEDFLTYKIYKYSRKTQKFTYVTQ